jgi:hypothetical protein
MARYHRATGEPDLLAGRVVIADAITVGGDYLDTAQATLFASDGVSASTPFGRYNPATGKWTFAREYVMTEERPAMERLMRVKATGLIQQGNAAMVDGGAPVVDVYHPYTRKVRVEMARLLRPLGSLLSRQEVRAAMAEPGSRVLAADAHTFAYPVMATELRPAELVEEVADGTITTPVIAVAQYKRFMLAAQDVKVENPTQAPGTSVRDSRSVTLARRSETDPTLWVPNPDVVDPERDWPTLLRVAEGLEAARAANPDFSLLHCAVTYGGEYGLARAQFADQ